MIHFGDITKLSGWDLPIVDCIIGGSPCQDLSLAGRRKGLDGERSGLFMDQVRIVKEMRERDRLENGRSGYLRRPRFMVWENVHGAFSSNGGKDFQAVLTEIVRIAESDAPDVPMPEKGKWPKAGCLYSDMGGWSIAWRVHDAQFWGVPQRRKRIALVADFGGLAAPEVLFERKGLSWHPEEGEETRKEAPGDPRSGIDPSGVLAFKQGAGSRAGGIGLQEEVAPTLNAASNGTNQAPVICYGISGFESNAMKSDNPHSGIYEADTARTLDHNGGSPACAQGGMAIVQPISPRVYDARGNGDGLTVPTITGDHENRVTDYTALCVGNGQINQMSMSEQANALDTMHDAQAILYVPGVAHALHAKANLQFREDSETYLVDAASLMVRRLTPKECERLQYFPDEWSRYGIDEKGEVYELSDTARYTLQGNSIARPFWKWLTKRISALYERTPTLGSLFDGQGGFPLCWEEVNGKGTAIWASEIEKHAIAVTKYHFAEEGGYVKN